MFTVLRKVSSIFGFWNRNEEENEVAEDEGRKQTNYEDLYSPQKKNDMTVSPAKQTPVDSVEEIDSITTNGLKKIQEEVVRTKIIVDVVDQAEKNSEEENVAPEVTTGMEAEVATNETPIEVETEKKAEAEKENASPEKMDLAEKESDIAVAETNGDHVSNGEHVSNSEHVSNGTVDLSRIEFNFEKNKPSVTVDKIDVLNSLYKNQNGADLENDDARSEVSEVSECGSVSETKTRRSKFICDDCGRSFKKNAFLLTHRRAHTAKSKPTPTEIIEQSYAQTDLKRKSFLCQICHREFKSQGFLNRHMRTIHK